MSDLKWEKFTRTDETVGVQVTEENILELARVFGGAVKYDEGNLVYISDYGYDVPLGGYLNKYGEPLSTEFSKVEAEPPYKVGDRVEIHGWSKQYWDGPATVKVIHENGGLSVDSDTSGGRGYFEPQYIRPLKEAPKEKVFGRGDFHVGDRVREADEAWSGGYHYNTADGTVTRFNDDYIVVEFDEPNEDNQTNYNCYDAFQLERV